MDITTNATWAKSSVHRQKVDNCFKQEAEPIATLNQSSVKVDASWPQQRRLIFIASHLMLMFSSANATTTGVTGRPLWSVKHLTQRVK
ncbi:hypothetical protein T10_13620 [Trichinella papuae]|uniref:Uncharacterized protein n=1 Tax=Trichinella papuae TaxID=268474 RepID=A0A0V1N7H9_9BILA|nr:hypothetical protein T10_13620 [Trichinella papuae]